MIMNDKPNCQVSRILMNPRPIYGKRSENDSIAQKKNYKKSKNEAVRSRSVDCFLHCESHLKHIFTQSEGCVIFGEKC
jgi:GTP cyclohydrolase I